MPDGSLRAAVVSYTAFSPLPDRSGGLFSAALSFPRIAPRHPSLHGRTPCSAESGLSSPLARGDRRRISYFWKYTPLPSLVQSQIERLMKKFQSFSGYQLILFFYMLH